MSVWLLAWMSSASGVLGFDRGLQRGDRVLDGVLSSSETLSP
jgi:hypothetical protein